MIPRHISQGLRLIANGVFIVAAAADGKAHGFTATWVCQASFRNPLLTVAIDKGHDTYQLIQRTGRAPSYREIAAVLGTSAGSVGASLYRALIKLRALLADGEVCGGQES